MNYLKRTYKAIWSQTEELAPTVTEFINELPGTGETTVTYSEEGWYQINKSDGFPNNCIVTNIDSIISEDVASGPVYIQGRKADTDTYFIKCGKEGSGRANDSLNDAIIHFEVWEPIS